MDALLYFVCLAGAANAACSVLLWEVLRAASAHRSEGAVAGAPSSKRHDTADAADAAAAAPDSSMMAAAGGSCELRSDDESFRCGGGWQPGG